MSHETAQSARDRIMILEYKVRNDKRQDFMASINNSLQNLHKEILLDDLINREILYYEKFQEIDKLISLRAKVLNEKLQKAIILRTSAIMRSE